MLCCASVEAGLAVILYSDIMAVMDEVDAFIQASRQSGAQRAQNESDYRRELAVELLKLKADGMPVGLAKDIVRGIPAIAELKRVELASEAIYRADLEAAQAKKLRARIMQDEYNREWNYPRIGEGA